MCLSVSGFAGKPTQATVLGRVFDIILPANYNAASSYPLIMLLHGLGEDPNSTAAMFFGSTARAASAFGGSIVVLPKGTPNALGNRFWDVSDPCCRLGFGGPVDDITYLAAVLEYMFANFSVDRHFVVVPGYSNGAIAAQTLALCRPDLVTQFLAVAGFLVDTSDAHFCNPAFARPVGATIVHGNADTLIRWLGVSVGDDLADVPSGTYRSAPQTAAAWVTINGGVGALASAGTADFIDGIAGAEATINRPTTQAVDGSVEFVELNLAGHNPAFNAAAIWYFENRIRACRRNTL